MAKIGTLIDGKYEVLREIGRGGMSVVYLAMDTRLNKQWAIKEIARKANDANNEIVVSSLLAEANLMKKLDHPSLPRIVDIIEEHDTIYVVMDYIEGEPLSKILELSGAQDQDVVIEWGKQLCDVLFYLHNCEPPIIYRDMKPANVMLRPDGSVKLIDFGIAREYKRSKTADTESLGTRGYAAPEQFGGKGQTDARTDIYCFGVTLYHLVTGLNPCEPPYELYPIKQVNPNFYGGLQYLIQKCTQMNPEDRFQSCDEMRYVLDNIQEFEEGRRISQKKKFNAFIVMVVMTIVFSILGTGMLFGGKMALESSFSTIITNIENANTYASLGTAFDNVISAEDSGFDDDLKLEFLAAYMEKTAELSRKDETVSGKIPVIDIMEYVEDDIIPLDELDGEQSVYSELSNEQITNLAKFCIYRGEVYFSEGKYSEANSILIYLFDEKDGFLIDTNRYNTSEITEKEINDAKVFYYTSLIYTYFSNDSQSTDIYSATDTIEIDMEKTFSEVVKSVSLAEASSSDAIRRALYSAYYKMLDKQAKISNYNNKNIKVGDIDKIYTALYGESYKNIRNEAIALSPDGKTTSVTKAQTASMTAEKTDGLFSINPASWSEKSNHDSMEENLIVIADYIYNVYGE